VEVGVLGTQTGSAEREVLDDRRGRLAVDLVAVREGVLETGEDAVDVVLAHLANVLEQERQCLEAAVAHVELGRAVLVEDGRDAGEGSTSLGDDGCARIVRGKGQSCTRLPASEPRRDAPMATVLQTRDWRSCTLRLVRRTLKTS